MSTGPIDLYTLFDNIYTLSTDSVIEQLKANNIFITFVENKDGMIRCYQTNGYKFISNWRSKKIDAIGDLIYKLIHDVEDDYGDAREDEIWWDDT